MHDPMTVAHEIRYPWYRHRPWPNRVHRMDDERAWSQMTEAEKNGRSRHWRDGYRESFITIWHVDPERDGSDDSCGFCVPKLTRRQRERLKALAWNEARNPYFMRRGGHEWKGTRAEAESMYRGLLLQVARYLRVPMTFEQAAKEAAEVVHAPDCGDAANRFCYEPGYHTNSKTDSREERERYAHGMFCGIAAWMLKDRRRWWRHPRWHLWHWKVQCHPLQDFKRWAFSRCSKCGGRFAYGATVVSGSWSGTGPRWFRSEKSVYHDDCSGGCATGQIEKAEPATTT